VHPEYTSTYKIAIPGKSQDSKKTMNISKVSPSPDSNSNRGTDQLTDQLDRIENRVNDIYIAIHGNSEPGLKTLVDRNTNFRLTISKLIWILITPLYGVVLGLLIKNLF